MFRYVCAWVCTEPWVRAVELKHMMRIARERDEVQNAIKSRTQETDTGLDWKGAATGLAGDDTVGGAQ
jgi:hypothetical protein